MDLVAVHPVADELAARFAAAGHRLYLVGGSVRDALLGRGGTDLDFTPDARGKRHPWPKRVAGRYFIHQRGGNTAVRRVLLRVARSLKAGAERETVLAGMRRDMSPIQDRYDGLKCSTPGGIETVISRNTRSAPRQ